MRTSTPSSKPESRPLLKEPRRLQQRPAKPLIMGVLNCTPDSFYPMSRAADARSAIAQAQRMKDEGADWLDVGGQSTRPGSLPISVDEELRRVLPVIEKVDGVTISIDTDKAEVARRAREAGAKILNDVTGLRNPEMLAEAVKFEKVVIMHMGGDSPATMQKDPKYKNVVADVKGWLSERIAAFVRGGGSASAAYVDPGIGFGKTLEHNLSLIKHLSDFGAVAPVVLGVSRKSFLSKVTPDNGPEERLEGSLAVAAIAALSGSAAVLRVHDVLSTRRALDVVTAVLGAP